MTQLRRFPWSAAFVVMFLLLPGKVAAQSATETDDAFVSSNSVTQLANANGQGIALVVAGSSATVGPVHVGTTRTFIKFQLQSSLPPSVAAANVAKATLKLFISPSCNPTGAIDIYPITSAWSESTLSASTAPTLSSTAFATGIPVGKANSFWVVDATQLVKDWLEGSASGGLDNDGVALVANTAATNVIFDSKESFVTSHEPRLEIVLANSGPAGAAATVAVGTTTTLGPNGQAAVTNGGTANAAILNFAIPQGQPGATGPVGTTATVTVGTTATGTPGTSALVTNAGNSNAALLNFVIPQGLPGATGAQGLQGPQGPVGINNKGSWSNTTAYNPSDAVFDSASYWLATVANTGSEPSTTNTKWQLLAGGIVNRGNWSASNNYNVNDAASDGGSYWLALAPTSASSATPNTSCEPSQAACSADWQLLAQQGAPGAPGNAATLQIGQVSTGAAGTQASVTNTGSQSAAVLNFTIPQGAMGPTGQQGPPGPAGSAGNLFGAPLLFSAYFGKPLTGSSYTAGKFVPDNPITVTRVTAQVESAGDASCTPAVLRVTDGTKGEDIVLTGAQTEADSGSGVLTFASGANLKTSLRSGAACTGSPPNNANVTIEYRTQMTGDTDTCPTGQTPCNGICEPTSADPANCGACGTNCSNANVANATPNGTCSGGGCGFACTTGYGDCDHNPANGCETNLQASSANCGACGSACSSGSACCSSSCTNTSSDPGNCGACGNACFHTSGCCFVGSPIDCSNPYCQAGLCSACTTYTQTCNNGTCTCPTGQTACSNSCATLSSDHNNCGACGNACATGEQCFAQAVYPFPPTQVDCNGSHYSNQTAPSVCTSSACLSGTGVSCTTNSQCASGWCSSKTNTCN